MRKTLFILIAVAAVSLSGKDVFRHNLTGSKKPWTHENFLNHDGKFSFVIIPDRTGSERPGVFQEAIKKANMFQPDFIMTVGDLIQGPTEIDRQSPQHLREQWKELESFTKKSQAPFFYVVGNHDISRTRPGFPRANEDSKMVWQEFAGKDTYYCFIYKDVLFLCLNTMEGRDARQPQIPVTAEQVKWAVAMLKKHANVRWTLVFMHQIDICRHKEFKPVEDELQKRNYTVFAGDWHHYIKFKRHNRDHYVLATAGGVSKLRGKNYGEFDHITYVTMTEKGPVIANVMLDGILPENAVTAATCARTFRTMIDTEPFVPAPGYPWKAIIDQHTLDKYITKDNLSDNIITISGKSAKEIIPLSPSAVAGKKFRLTAATKANISGKGTFNVKLRAFNASGKIIHSSGITLTESSAWRRDTVELTMPDAAKKIDLCIETEHFDKKSTGETRYIFVEEIK